jgi:hypothetical protein
LRCIALPGRRLRDSRRVAANQTPGPDDRSRSPVNPRQPPSPARHPTPARDPCRVPRAAPAVPRAPCGASRGGLPRPVPRAAAAVPRAPCGASRAGLPRPVPQLCAAPAVPRPWSGPLTPASFSAAGLHHQHHGPHRSCLAPTFPARRACRWAICLFTAHGPREMWAGLAGDVGQGFMCGMPNLIDRIGTFSAHLRPANILNVLVEVGGLVALVWAT